MRWKFVYFWENWGIEQSQSTARCLKIRDLRLWLDSNKKMPMFWLLLMWLREVSIFPQLIWSLITIYQWTLKTTFTEWEEQPEQVKPEGPYLSSLNMMSNKFKRSSIWSKKSWMSINPVKVRNKKSKQGFYRCSSKWKKRWELLRRSLRWNWKKNKSLKNRWKKSMGNLAKRFRKRSSKTKRKEL